MQTKTKLAIGTMFRYDGENWKIEGFNDGNLQIRSGRGNVAIIAIGALIGGPGFAFLETDDNASDNADTDTQDSVTFADNVPEAAIADAKILLEHLNEMETGYRSGYLGTALLHEPRPQYDPIDTTTTQRIAAKAAELGVSERALWANKAAYKSSGIYGLVDQRQVRLVVNKIDVRIIDALHEVVRDLINSSNATNNNIIRRIERALKAKYAEHDIVLPSKATMHRLIARETKNKSLKSSAKGRRSIDNGPATTYRRFYATRPGEMVLIDTTSLDAYAMEPVTFQWIQVQLTIAIDLFSRSIVGWRFTPISTKGVDAALLLYDVVRPKVMLKNWPESARWSYVGVPEHIVLEIADIPAEQQIAGIPFIQPDSIVVDHGKVFISQTFRDACSRLGTNLQLARPYTPTDKAHVERMFRTIRENFVMELPGYKGPDVYSRGLNPEGETYYFIDEIEEKFAVWVAVWWQRRHHSGLDLPYLPHLNMSPNDMYEEGLARAGFVHMVSTENLYFELLPTVWRTIQSYGIEFRGLRYDGDILNDFRHVTSPYTGVHTGKWPVRFDPRDLSTAYFYDYEGKVWCALAWCHSEGNDRPFNEGVLAYAKTLLVTRSGDVKNTDEISETLNDILDGIHVADIDLKKRRMFAANAIHAKQAADDTPLRKYDGGTHAIKIADSEIPYDAPKSPDFTISNDERILRILDVDEALENDDDDLGY